MTAVEQMAAGVFIEAGVAAVVNAKLAVEITRYHPVAVHHLVHAGAQAERGSRAQARRPEGAIAQRGHARDIDDGGQHRAEGQADREFVVGAEEIRRHQPDEQAADGAAQRHDHVEAGEVAGVRLEPGQLAVADHAADEQGNREHRQGGPDTHPGDGHQPGNRTSRRPGQSRYAMKASESASSGAKTPRR